MEFIFENPLARMYGPDFLVLYFAIYIVCLFLAKFTLPDRIGNRNADENPPVPEQPEPYKVAYLRSGENEVLILAVFNLIRRKYFLLERPRSVYTLKKGKVDETTLNAVEREVYHCLESKASLGAFVKDTLNNKGFLAQCEGLRKELQQEKLLWADKDANDYKRRIDILTSVLILLGTYKLIAAIIHEHYNVLGLILIAALGSYLFSRIKTKVRPSAKGLSLLAKLRSAFKAVHGNKLLEQPAYIEQLLLSVYGFGILANSSYALFYNYVREEVNPDISTKFETVYTGDHNHSSSGCGGGSSCSGGSGCGSSCGGGCGGCGGCS